MPRRMKAHPDTVVDDGLAIRQGLQREIVAQASAQYTRAGCSGKIVLMADASVVAMRVRDDRAIYRSPWVDKDITLRTVQTFRC